MRILQQFLLLTLLLLDLAGLVLLFLLAYFYSAFTQAELKFKQGEGFDAFFFRAVRGACAYFLLLLPAAGEAGLATRR